MRTALALACLPAVAFAAPDAPDVPEPAEGTEAPDPIVNGEVDERFPAVVSIGASFGNPFHVCTGTMITDRVLLTAGHCGADLPVELIVQLGQAFVGPNLSQVEQQFGFIDYIGHPEYTGIDNGSGQGTVADIGIGIIDGSVDVEPIFFNTRELDDGDIDTELLSVGYGSTSGEGGGSGVKRSTPQIVAGYEDDTIRTANSLNPGNGNICSGDSGGPMMFIDEDDRPTIWAVHSYGDQNCAIFSSSTRTDLHVDWILDRIEDVHDSRDLCDINGLYANGTCDEDCEADPECVTGDDDDDDDGANGSGCQSSVAGSGSGLAALLLLPFLGRRRRTSRTSGPPGVAVATRAGFLLLALGLLLPTAAFASKPALPTLSEAEMAKVQAGKVVLKKTEDDAGVTTVNAVCELAAKPAELWPILFSVDHIKASTSSIKELTSTLDETAANGDRKINLTYILKVGWSEIRYSVKRTFVSAEETMTWVLDKDKEADIEWTEGSYSVYPGSTAGTTMFLYRARIDTGKSIPAWIEEDLTESSLKRYLKYLKETAEK